MPWSYVLIADDDARCMRLAREIGDGLSEDEIVGLAMAIAQSVQDYFSYMQSDHSDEN